MKNVFKFNRAFSVLLLLSVANASAIKYDFDSPCFNGTKAAYSATPVVATSIPKVRVPAIAAPAVAPVTEIFIPAVVTPAIEVSAPAVTKAPDIEATTPTVEVKPTWTATLGGLWDSAKLSNAGQAISSGYSRAAEQVNARAAITAAISVVVISIVSYMLHKRKQAKATPVTPTPAPVAPTKAPLASIRKTSDVKTEVKRSGFLGLSSTVTIVTPVERSDYEPLISNYQATNNKAMLIAIQTGFEATGRDNVNIVRYIAHRFNVGNNAAAISAKLAELIAA